VLACSIRTTSPALTRARLQEKHLAQEEDAKKVNADDVKTLGNDLQAERSLDNQIAGEELEVLGLGRP